MSPASAPVRCPGCRASVAPGTRWCLLCFEPFAAPPAPEDAVRDAGLDVPDPLPAAPQSRPDRDAVARVAEDMLATLAGSSRADPRTRLAAVAGPLAPLLATRAGRVGTTAGLCAAVSAALVLAMALLGVLLG